MRPSSSSLTECRERNEPKILEGRPDLCKLCGLDLGEKKRSMLLLELFRSRGGFEWVEVGLEDGSGVKKDAGRRFLRVAEVGTGWSSSSMGVRAFTGGLNMLKLFRRRRSDIVLFWEGVAQMNRRRRREVMERCSGYLFNCVHSTRQSSIVTHRWMIVVEKSRKDTESHSTWDMTWLLRNGSCFHLI